MARLRVPFNARLYEIQRAFTRDDLGPLIGYLRSGIIDVDVQVWLAKTIDPDVTRGNKLVIKKAPHRPPGGKAADRSLAIAEALEALVNDPADQRTKTAKVREIATTFGCSADKVWRDHGAWKEARGL